MKNEKNFYFYFFQISAGPSETFKDHCNKTVDIYEDVASPEVTNQNRGRPMTCWYRFRSFRGAPRDWVLRLRFKKFKVGTLVNATYCEGGFLQVRPIFFCFEQKKSFFYLPFSHVKPCFPLFFMQNNFFSLSEITFVMYIMFWSLLLNM